MNKLPNFNEKQKKEFVNGYYSLIQKWKKEFKPSIKERLYSWYSQLVWDYMMKKDWKNYFENSIKNRKKLIKFTNNLAEKEIILCWINMDKETIKWKSQINRQRTLQSKQKKLIEKFESDEKFINALNVYKSQISLLNILEIFNKSVLYKVRQQEKIYILSKQLDKNKSNKKELIALGVIADILSKNDKLIGTSGALIYTTLRNYKSDFMKSVLLTEKLKKKVKHSRQRTKIILGDLTKLIKEVKNES